MDPPQRQKRPVKWSKVRFTRSQRKSRKCSRPQVSQVSTLPFPWSSESALAGSPDQREPGTTSKIAGKSLRRLGAAAPELREVHTAGQARAYAHPRCVPPSL